MWMLYILLAVLILLVLWWIDTSNSFRKKENKIRESASGVEVALTKRYDMLTKLLDVAKDYMKHESELFTQTM